MPSPRNEEARSSSGNGEGLAAAATGPRASAADLDVFFKLALAVAQADARTGRLLRVNAAVCELTGYTQEELVGMKFSDLTHPDDRERDLAAFNALIAGEVSTFESEKRYVRKDGSFRWVLVTGTILRDAGGEPLQTIAVGQDITDRRRAEDALRESEARMRSLLDSTAEAMWGLDLEGRCTFVNAGCLRLLGFERAEEVLGRNMHQLTHAVRPDGSPYPEQECRIHDALRSGELTDVEDEVFFRKDGSPMEVHYRASPVIREGAVAGAVVTFRDVSEERRAQADRARTAALLHTLADNAAEALYLMDAEGRTTFMNPAAERMFGWSREDTVGKVLHDLIHYKRPDGSAFAMQECPLGAVIATGTPALDHFDQFVHKDGRLIPVSCSNAPVVTGGLITGAVLVVHDLTERQRNERDAQRHREFEQQLLGIVSHDLRNPIAAILLSTQALMRRADVPAPVLKALSRIAVSGERANRLIRDLLDFAQARLGRGIPIHPRRASLHELVQQVVDEVQQAHPERDLVFQSAGDGVGSWDADRIAQVATNLMVNAVTYSVPDSPVVVRTHGDPDAVVLEIENQGEPIPEDKVPLLFLPFRRGGQQDAGAVGNIGLGLFIVDQIVTAHGGSVQVHSTAERTRFTVRLPRSCMPSGAEG